MKINHHTLYKDAQGLRKDGIGYCQMESCV